MDKRYVPATELEEVAEVPEQGNDSEENLSDDSAAEIESPKPTSQASQTPQKRRRRAVSTGVITPN